ncbi:MAG TPA: hypothetical protein VGQ16_03725 [Vicinamibacterales bacterium]|nr:hypothetical protein [Vicinamibacterales bacterium]
MSDLSDTSDTSDTSKVASSHRTAGMIARRSDSETGPHAKPNTPVCAIVASSPTLSSVMLAQNPTSIALVASGAACSPGPPGATGIAIIVVIPPAAAAAAACSSP